MRIAKRIAAAAALAALSFGAIAGGNVGWPDSNNTTAGDPVGWPDSTNETTAGEPVGWPDIAGHDVDA